MIINSREIARLMLEDFKECSSYPNIPISSIMWKPDKQTPTEVNGINISNVDVFIHIDISKH